MKLILPTPFKASFLFILLALTPTFAQELETVYSIPRVEEAHVGEGPFREGDWFERLWQSKHAAWAKTVEQDQGAVVFFGDSITQGWGGGLGSSFPGMKVANRGISGDVSRGLLVRIENDVLALNPAAVVILIGTNDISVGATNAQIVGNMKLILAKLQEHNPELPIIFCEVFPSSESKERPSERIRELNDLYLNLVKGDSRVIYLDTFDLFDDGNGDAIPAEFPDLLHLNELGYAKWAAALRPVLETLELLPVDDVFVLEEGYESLFNGRDLTGWGYRPSSEQDRIDAAGWRKSDPIGAAAWPFVTEAEHFNGLEMSPDGRFAAINGRLVVTTPPERRKIQKLWTTREFSEDFILKMEFRATPDTDSGIYIRGPQLQCRDYSLAGPWKDLKNYKPQGWNSIVIEVRGNEAHCTCNGEVLETGFPLPGTGPIGVEGDKGQMEYRRIRIKKL